MTMIFFPCNLEMVGPRAFNSRWDQTVAVRHPSLWTFLRHQKDSQANVEVKGDAVDRGDLPPPRERKWRQLEARIQRLKRQIITKQSILMADHGHKMSPLKLLKKMSLKRHQLKKSSKELSRSLERLQQVNRQQDPETNSSLSDLHQHQQDVEQMVITSPDQQKTQHDRDTDTDSVDESVEKEGAVFRKRSEYITRICSWTTLDVIHWLKTHNLHKFILLFQRHHVSGQDLSDIKLPFLDGLDHISAPEREHLLGEIYKLLNPESISVSHEALDRITSPVDKEKYLAAIQLAKDSGYAVNRSASLLVLPTNLSSPSSSTLSIDAATSPKQRTKSESDQLKDNSLKLMPPPRHKRLKASAAKLQNNASSSLYTILREISSHRLECIEVRRQMDGFGLTLGKDSNGCFVVDSVEDDLTVPVFVGDRVLEMNGILTLQSTDSLNACVDEISQTSQSLQLVLLRDSQTNTKAGTNGLSEWKWEQLRALLLDMRDKDGDTTELLKYFPLDQMPNLDMSLVNDIQYIQYDLCMQMTVHYVYFEGLKMVIESSLKCSLTSDGESQNYTVTLENLKLDTASKEDVVDSLKEIVKEASRQKWYLDRLISLVIEEAPWLLDQIDSDLENLNVTHPEEFC
ncbi:hypothetical protein ScPMuIL_005624 [Solemya velum]